MKAKRYVAKPCVVEAVQYRGHYSGLKTDLPKYLEFSGGHLVAKFKGLMHLVNIGDWVVRHGDGTIDVMSDEEFWMRYDVEEETQ